MKRTTETYGWSLRRNVAWVVFGEFVNRALPLLVLAHAARRLGPAALGRAQFTVTLLETAGPFVVYGYTYIGILAAMESSQGQNSEARETLLRMVALRLLHAVFAIGLGAGALALVPAYTEHALWFLAFSPALVITALDCTYLFIAARETGKLTLVTTLAKLVLFSLAIVLVRSDTDAWRYAAFVLGVNAVTSLYSLWKWAPALLRSEGVSWRRVLAPRAAYSWFCRATPFACVLTVLPLFDRGDIYAIERLGSPDASGRYQALAKLAQSAAGLVSAIMFPFLSEFVNARDETRVSRLLALCLTVGFAVAGGAFVGVTHFGREFLSVFLGTAFALEPGILTVLCLGLFCQTIIYVLGMQVLLLRGKQLTLAAFLAIGFLAPTIAAQAFSLADGQSIALTFLAAKAAVAACTLWAASRTVRIEPRLAATLATLVVWCLLTFGARRLLVPLNAAAWNPAGLALGFVALAGYCGVALVLGRGLGFTPAMLLRRRQ